MTSIRFFGDLPLWAGALLALLAGLGAWVYYRREIHDLPGRLRWLLPGLRAVAVLLLLLVLTGPVLRHRQVIGQLGRVLVFLDGSESMRVMDPHIPVARKLAIAQQHGWLHSENIDMSLWETANELSRVKRDLLKRLASGELDRAALAECRDSFAQQVRLVADPVDRLTSDPQPLDDDKPAEENVAPNMGARFRTEVVDPAQSLLGQPLDTADSRGELAQRLLDLAQKAGTFESLLLDAFDAYGARLAASGNRSAASAIAVVDKMSRWRRAEDSLLGSSKGLLARLTRRHDVELFLLTGSEVEGLWDRQVAEQPPAALLREPQGSSTDLASGIAGRVAGPSTGDSGSSNASDAGQRTAVVLITDGQHNAGDSPLQTARLLGGRTVPVFAVGFGCKHEPPDLALLEIEHPDLVFQKDRIRGTIVMKDHMPAGQSFVVQISNNDDVLWQEQLTTENRPLRRVEFEFSVDELVDQLRTRFDADVKHHALPLSLRVSIAPLEGETEATNNEMALRFAAITQSHKILLIDGRSRWETRYIRNVFERDEQWDINTLLVGPGTDQATLPRGEGDGMFPTEEDALFEYDLILFGDVAPDLLADYEQTWIRNFVEQRGGGIIFLDGRSGNLQRLGEESLRPLVPVTWLTNSVSSLPERLQLTNQGASESALLLELTSAVNESLWQELPAPHQLVPVEAVPGTEVLAEAVVQGTTFPVIVSRSFGAGRVLYLAFDETWRWRYKAADTYHQRFWNQLAKWVMQKPFAVSDQYVAIDSGPTSYKSGQSADIRVRLRGVDGRPISGATVDAILSRDGQVVSTVSLTDDTTSQGIYRGRSDALSDGEYEVSVRAEGFSTDALKARSSFTVLPPESEEMQRIACNDELLQEMASLSGGRALAEEQIEQIIDLLDPLSSGRIVESETLLWQSYWWFAAIVGLLSIEWMLRKRAGLL